MISLAIGYFVIGALLAIAILVYDEAAIGCAFSLFFFWPAMLAVFIPMLAIMSAAEWIRKRFDL